MTYVGYDWTEIGRNTDTSHGGTIKIRCIAWSEQNISNNTSVIHFKWQKAWDDANSAYTIHWEDAHDYSITTSGHSANMTFALGSLVGANPDDWHDIGDGDYWGSIAHNADGSCSLSFDANGYRYWDAFSFSGTIELPTIPRTSNVSLNKSTATLNGSDGFVIYTNRASSSFSHNIYQNISGSWVQIAGGVGDNYTWIPSTNFYENIGNSSKTYQILCQTWSGGTHIGDSQVNFTLASAGVHQCSLSTSSITLNGSNGVRIYTNRNSGSFVHGIEQNFLGSMAPLHSDYNVTDYLDWTPPIGWYNAIGGGSKTFTIRVHCKNNTGTYLGYTDVSFTINSAGADSVSLNNTNMTMGTKYTVSIAKRVSSFRHTVTWAFCSASGTLGTEKAVDTSVDWTPSTDLSAQMPSEMTTWGRVICQTYYGDTSIGSNTVTFNLSVPSYNVVLGTPTITETGKDNTGTALTKKGVGANEVVAIMSIKRLVVSATTSYNATIKNISVTFGGATKTASSGSFDNTFSGMMNGNLTITATDSRGRALANTYSQSYTFRDYFKPSVTSFNGDRASQTGDTGTLNAAGTFWNKTAGATANVLAGAISISATGATTIVPDKNNWTTAFDVSGVTYQNSYNFKIIVTDSFGFTAEKTYTLNASVPVMWKGKHTVRINRNLVVGNIVKAPTFVGSLNGNATSASSIPLDKIYPVGAIYLSVDSTSPAALFGGTWERIKDRFLLAAGDTYAAESTGGEAKHKLTIDEMPYHEHEQRAFVYGYSGWPSADIPPYTVAFSYGGGSYFQASGTVSVNGTMTSMNSSTSGCGGGNPHNNMPPYLAVYMWKRIA
jgi:hypothetical protein